ncbi:MAG: carbohydrate kinase family protein [Candidatus Aenigmatarchaeota archaeon]
MNITVIGDAFLDIIVPVEGVKIGNTYHRKIRVFCGGTANVAVWISRLGEKARFVGKVGNDVFGEYFKQNLRREGVEDLTLIDSENRTGLCISLVSEDGERTMIADRGANNNLNREDIERCIDKILGSKIVYFSGYTLLSEKTREAVLYAMKECRGKSEVWFNPGAPNIVKDYFMEYISKHVDGLITNLEEAKALTEKSTVEEAIQALRKAASVVVVTMGKEGCTVSINGNCEKVPTQSIEARDTTGAGDAFSAGFLVGRLKGMGILDCAVLGNETARKFLLERAKAFL